MSSRVDGASPGAQEMLDTSTPTSTPRARRADGGQSPRSPSSGSVRQRKGTLEVGSNLGLAFGSAPGDGGRILPSNVGKPLFMIMKDTDSHAVVPKPRPRRNCYELDPLSEAERRSVSARIRQDISDAAVNILGAEQQAKSKLHTVHIKCISLMIIAAVAVGFGMVYLRVVLVPFILAIFFMFLLEPLLFTILQTPGVLLRIFPGLARYVPHLEHDDKEEADSTLPGSERSASKSAACGTTGAAIVQSFVVKVYRLFAVIVCIFVLLGTAGFMIYLLVESLTTFPWRKYAASPKLQMVLDWYPELGATNTEEMNFETIVPWLLQGPLFDALDVTFAILGQTFLTILFLAFLLANDIAIGGPTDGMLEKKVRGSVRRYIRIKTVVAAIVAVLCGLFYWQMKVDLFILFGFLTFVLCYIPHLGNTVAVILPLPLVFFDPTKTWMDLFTVFVVPFIIHQLASNLVEPKLLAESLDLHPIVVLLSLAFWTTVWGAVGAILSVPLTAVSRILLLEVEHPYAVPIVKLLKGEIMRPTDKFKNILAAASPRAAKRRPSEESGSPPTSPRLPKKALAGSRFILTPSPNKSKSPPADESVPDSTPSRNEEKGSLSL